MSDPKTSPELSIAEEKLDRVREWAQRGSQEFHIERLGMFPRAAIVAYQEGLVAGLKGKGKRRKADEAKADEDPI